jgi:hypothetical protein
VPFSYAQYAGNGSATTFSVPFPYLLKAHVKLFYGYNLTSGAFTSELVDGVGFTWTSGTQVQTTVAPAVGQTLTIVRQTPSNALAVQWQDGSNLVAEDLQDSSLQTLYAVQEQDDVVSLSAAESATAAASSAAAVTTANAASATANGIAGTANTALSNSSAAVTTANAASATATAAQTTANGIAGTANTALSNSSAAVTTANAADATANGIAGTANTALSNSSAAVTTANAADATANGIAGTANTALSNSTAAQSTANAALPQTGGTLTGNITVPSLNGGPLAGFRNRIINGNFDIWQRGTSFTGYEYGADRWIHHRVGTTHTATRQPFPLGQTDVPGEPKYFCSTVVSSVAGAGNNSHLEQFIEDVRTFAGQQITVSFWAKVDATKNIAVDFFQFFDFAGGGSAPVTNIGVTKISIGTSWQKVTIAVNVPSISGKTIGSSGKSYLACRIWFDAGSNFTFQTDSLGQQSGTFEIAQVQIEPGPVATPFEQRPIGTELALCQRYFFAGRLFIPTTGSLQNVPLPVSMRTTMSLAVILGGGAGFSIADGGSANCLIAAQTTGSGQNMTVSTEL